MLALLLAAATATAPAPAPAPEEPPKIEVHGEVRGRGEGMYELDLDRATETTGPRWNDGERFLLRTRLGLEGRPIDDVSLFAQLQDSRTFGQPTTTATSLNNVDLRQGWLEVRNVGGLPFSFKLGRMELAYGDQRLVGAFGWDNVGRSFDAVQTRSTLGEFTLDAFWARLHADPRTEANRPLGDDLAGLYGMWRRGALQLDAYVLGLYDRGGLADADGDGNPEPRLPGDGGIAQDLRLFTPGVRVDARPIEGVHLNGEFAYQAGARGDLDVSAWAFHTAADYTFAVPFSPMVLVGYDRASGDSDPDDESWGTFENLFPTNHDKYGLMDLASWKNLSDLYVGAGVKPAQTVALNASVHLLARADSEDTFYRANGAPLRTRAAALETDADDVGTELDLTATWQVTRGVGILAGWSKLWAGGFLDETAADGSSPNPAFGYLQVTGGF